MGYYSDFEMKSRRGSDRTRIGGLLEAPARFLRRPARLRKAVRAELQGSLGMPAQGRDTDVARHRPR